MSAHQRLFVTQRAEQRRDRGGAFQVTERDGHVAEKTAAFGAQNRARAETAAKIVAAERQEPYQIGARQISPRREHVFGGGSRLDVIRAHVLAYIAAENMIADQRPE